MYIHGLLPIGSVVLLKESTKKLMIVGLCQKGASDGKLWEYVGVVFPEGFLSPDKMFLFNGDQIEQLFAVGFQDTEQLVFKEKIDKVMDQLKEQTGQ